MNKYSYETKTYHLYYYILSHHRPANKWCLCSNLRLERRLEHSLGYPFKLEPEQNNASLK